MSCIYQVKVHYLGYGATDDAWVSLGMLKCKALPKRKHRFAQGMRLQAEADGKYWGHVNHGTLWTPTAGAKTKRFRNIFFRKYFLKKPHLEKGQNAEMPEGS